MSPYAVAVIKLVIANRCDLKIAVESIVPSCKVLAKIAIHEAEISSRNSLFL